ncbi:MAG: hypothetical protein AB8B99_14405 [Phormidesmis sp.]
MQPVSYQISLGTTTYTPTDRPFLMALRCQMALDIPLHSCRIVLGQAENITVTPEDVVRVKLGYGNRLGTVFTGIVQSVETGIKHLTIQAISACYPLTLTRFNKIYEQPTAGDIVTDVAKKKLKLVLKKVENGLSFPVYALGDRTTAYDHISKLALQCGFDFYADPDDKIIFAKYKAMKTHPVTYGKNLLRLSQTQPLPSITDVAVYGESPASQGQGNQAYAWLSKKEVKGVAGKNTRMGMSMIDPTARTQALASKIAQATLTHATAKKRGQSRVLGDATIHLGDAINLSNLRSASQNGTFKVTGVTQCLDRFRGFYTDISWREI